MEGYEVLDGKAAAADVAYRRSEVVAIYPITPWTTDAHGRGPAWSNSLCEDDTEFGLGMRLALEHQAGRTEADLTGPTTPRPSGRSRRPPATARRP